jgi:hypothetical protein
MGKFDTAFDAPNPLSMLSPAMTSVQSSLYQRLRRSRGSKAGEVAWLLVRLVQRDHRDHKAATEAFDALPPSVLQDLWKVARATRDSPVIRKRIDTAELATAIALYCETAIEMLQPARQMTPEESAAFRKALDGAKDAPPAPVLGAPIHTRKPKTHQDIRNIATRHVSACPIGPALDDRLASGEWELV